MMTTKSKTCKVCPNTLGKKNRSGYCKTHFKRGIKVDNDVSEDNKGDDGLDERTIDDILNDSTPNDDINVSISSKDSVINDQNLLSIIKESMTREKLWHEETKKILIEQIEHLKGELATKDKIIEHLIAERNVSADVKVTNTDEAQDVNNDNQPTVHERKTNVAKTSGITKFHPWQVEEDVSLSPQSSISAGSLTTTDDEDCYTEIARKSYIKNTRKDEKSNSLEKTNRRNEKPQSDNENTRPMIRNDEINLHKRTQPGNSKYADVTKKGKKVLILSDSLCGGIQMDKLNPLLKNAHAYKVIHPGATAERIQHNCIFDLEHEQPDAVIINCGTNNIGNSESADSIYKTIRKIVKNCHDYGVNDVFVSSIPIRYRKKREVDEVNDRLRQRAVYDDYVYIDNNEITIDDITPRGGVHLKYKGTCILADNFIKAINDIRNF